MLINTNWIRNLLPSTSLNQGGGLIMCWSLEMQLQICVFSCVVLALDTFQQILKWQMCIYNWYFITKQYSTIIVV